MTTPPKAPSLMDDLVNRFLGWKLPADFSPDAGISFKAEFNENTPFPMKHDPTGTNLLTAIQAKAMLEFVVGAALVEHEALKAENETAYRDGVTAGMRSRDLEVSILNGQLTAAQAALDAERAKFNGLRSAWENNMSAPIGECPACDAIDVFLDALSEDPGASLAAHNAQVLEQAWERVQGVEGIEHTWVHHLKAAILNAPATGEEG